VTSDTDRESVMADDLAANIADGGDDDIELKVAEIEETREELTATVEALGDRLAPTNVIADAKQTVRDATVGRVEETVNNVTQNANRFLEDPAGTAQQAGTGILETIRQNPLPAALVGVGVGWLLLGRNDRSRSLEFRTVRSDRRPASWERGWDETRRDGGGVGQVTDTIGRRASDTADTVSQAAGQAAETVGRTVGQLGDAAGEVPTQAATMTRSLADQASRLIQSNPLGAGIAALAVGTVVGTLLPTTRVEHDVMGQASERLIEGAGQAAQQSLRGVGSSSGDASFAQDDTQSASQSAGTGHGSG